METKHPTHAGQAVQNSRGDIGITTTSRDVRTPTIGVMLVGMPYDIKAQWADWKVIEIMARG